MGRLKEAWTARKATIAQDLKSRGMGDTIDFSILGACRLGATRLGYHSGVFLMQIGRRLSSARLGWARLGGTRLNMTSAYDALRCFEDDTLQISQSQGDTPTLTVDVKEDYATRPAAGDTVICGIGTLKNRLFLGRIGRLTEPEKLGWTTYSIDADHVSKDLEGVKVFDKFTNKYASEILQELFTDHTTGYFWRNSNKDGLFFSSKEFRGESLFQIGNQLAELSGVKFSITNNKWILFDEPIERDLAAVADPPRYEVDLTLTEDCKEFISQVVMLYSDVSSLTQSFKGDGTQEEFNLSLPAYSVTSLTVNGSPVTWGERNKEDNSNNDFSIDLDTGVIYTSDHATLTASDTLTIVYLGRVPARLTVTDGVAKTLWASISGTPGIVTRVEDARDIISREEAQEAAENLLMQYARIYYEGAYSIKKPVFALPDIKIGDKQAITARSRNISLQIQKIDISIYVPGTGERLYLQYDVSLGERVYSLEKDLKKVDDKTNKESDQVISEVTI